jgi:eukaryotic-like serine/threonine-protein kinase
MIIYPGTIVYDQNKAEYEVKDFLGNGSFGDVYKINKRDNNEVFALKTIHASFPSHNVLKSFVNEGNLALGILHENVIKYYYFHDGSVHNTLPPYIIMEFAEDGNLQEKLQSRVISKSYFSNDELTSIFSQLINGMDAINKKLIHRDIKPDNVLISNDTYKITDFGLSKIVLENTRTSTFKGFGCIQYLAPEGWNFEKNTIQMDIYSMGFVFYELATLHHPLSVKTNDIKEWNEAHLFQSVKTAIDLNNSLSPILSQLIMRMIEKNTSDRYQNWNDIAASLKKQNQPATPISNFVDNSLENRLRQDNKIEEEKLKEKKRSDEIKNFNKIVAYQIENKIIEPIKNFSDEFNSKYEGPKIQFSKIHSQRDGEFDHSITMPSRKNIRITFKSIIEEDFIRRQTVDDYGRKSVITSTEIPEYNNKKLMAWGFIKGNDGRGFNLILVEKKDEVYGEWHMLVNTSSALSRGPRRPSPFPFEFSEIEKEIKNIRAIHIYNTDAKIFDLDYLIQFFSEYI